MATYTNTDVLNQNAVIAAARTEFANAQAGLVPLQNNINAAQAQLQVIQTTMQQQAADAALAAAQAAKNPSS